MHKRSVSKDVPERKSTLLCARLWETRLNGSDIFLLLPYVGVTRAQHVLNVSELRTELLRSFSRR
ncbi:hypothetical protein BN2476_110063 [Paraburkholderia piptadeniae]|uniref:Uncharacterized protein n=1 Tax=Paraburkholderia piptadeniae TaxID=1701573 RepID=A0A1N7RPH7_9BURK|nr:hypothetical protein BN2476_110063 [Paraburkholderia piptadeniae]